MYHLRPGDLLHWPVRLPEFFAGLNACCLFTFSSTGLINLILAQKRPFMIPAPCTALWALIWVESHYRMRLRSVSSAIWGSPVSGTILRMRGRNRRFPGQGLIRRPYCHFVYFQRFVMQLTVFSDEYAGLMCCGKSLPFGLLYLYTDTRYIDVRWF
jgi:hypothetical protein